MRSHVEKERLPPGMILNKADQVIGILFRVSPIHMDVIFFPVVLNKLRTLPSNAA